MRVIEQKGEHSYAFSRFPEPIGRVKPGEEIVLHTEDCNKGVVKSEADLPAKVRKEPNKSNPQTGPLFIEGAEPGDALAVHILNIEPDRDWAVSNTNTYFGALTPNKFTPMLAGRQPEKVYIYRFDKEGMLRYNDFLRFPWRPFMGTIATAPEYEAVSTMVPFENGGNMDCPDVKPGNIVYLPVCVEGAYFFTGDVHAGQGEGELCGTAMEIAAKVTLRFEVLKGKKITWPRIESPSEYMVVGSARPMEDAARIAYHGLIEWMIEFGWDPVDAYQGLTQAGKLYCANMVDPNYSMVAKADKGFVERRGNAG